MQRAPFVRCNRLKRNENEADKMFIFLKMDLTFFGEMFIFLTRYLTFFWENRYFTVGLIRKWPWYRCFFSSRAQNMIQHIVHFVHSLYIVDPIITLSKRYNVRYGHEWEVAIFDSSSNLNIPKPPIIKNPAAGLMRAYVRATEMAVMVHIPLEKGDIPN